MSRFMPPPGFGNQPQQPMTQPPMGNYQKQTFPPSGGFGGQPMQPMVQRPPSSGFGQPQMQGQPMGGPMGQPKPPMNSAMDQQREQQQRMQQQMPGGFNPQQLGLPPGMQQMMQGLQGGFGALGGQFGGQQLGGAPQQFGGQPFGIADGGASMDPQSPQYAQAIQQFNAMQGQQVGNTGQMVGPTGGQPQQATNFTSSGGYNPVTGKFTPPVQGGFNPQQQPGQPLGGQPMQNQPMQGGFNPQQQGGQQSLMQQRMASMPQAPTTQQAVQENPRMAAMRNMQQMRFGNR